MYSKRDLGVNASKFHLHVEDLDIRHAYIKRGTPRLNGNVERSHRSAPQEFYHLLSYQGDVDLEAKLDEWERFYNFHRPHSAFKGRCPMKRSEKSYNHMQKMSHQSPEVTILPFKIRWMSGTFLHFFSPNMNYSDRLMPTVHPR